MPTTELKRMLSLVGTKAEWDANDITPLYGELCLEIDGTEFRAKFGNGVNAYSELPYLSRETVAEWNQRFDDRLAAYGTATSAGAPDAGRLVRLDSQGLLHPSLIPSNVNLSFTYKGAINARDGAPPSAQTGDVYRNTVSGTYGPTWAGGNVDGTCNPDDLVVYLDGAWYKLNNGLL